MHSDLFRKLYNGEVSKDFVISLISKLSKTEKIKFIDELIFLSTKEKRVLKLEIKTETDDNQKRQLRQELDKIREAISKAKELRNAIMHTVRKCE